MAAMVRSPLISRAGFLVAAVAVTTFVPLPMVKVPSVLIV